MFYLFLIRLLMGKRKTGPSPVERQRERETEPVVVNCPMCGAVSLSMHVILEEGLPGRTPEWRVVNEVYRCGACHCPLEADQLENDGAGVMRGKSWICTKCKAPNTVLKSLCVKCKQWRD